MDWSLLSEACLIINCTLSSQQKLLTFQPLLVHHPVPYGTVDLVTWITTMSISWWRRRWLMACCAMKIQSQTESVKLVFVERWRGNPFPNRVNTGQPDHMRLFILMFVDRCKWNQKVEVSTGWHLQMTFHVMPQPFSSNTRVKCCLNSWNSSTWLRSKQVKLSRNWTFWSRSMMWRLSAVISAESTAQVTLWSSALREEFCMNSYINAYTPQQNGVAERLNRTIIQRQQGLCFTMLDCLCNFGLKHAVQLSMSTIAAQLSHWKTRRLMNVSPEQSQMSPTWRSLVVCVMSTSLTMYARSYMLKHTKQSSLVILVVSRDTRCMMWRVEIYHQSRCQILWRSFWSSCRETRIIWYWSFPAMQYHPRKSRWGRGWHWWSS